MCSANANLLVNKTYKVVIFAESNTFFPHNFLSKFNLKNKDL